MPSAARIPDALGTYPVTVEVIDSSGLLDSQTYAIEVRDDLAPPTLQVLLSSNTIPPGGTVDATLIATDDVGVASVTATLDGQPLTLDAQGNTSFLITVPGAHLFSVTATDLNGNTVTETRSIRVQTSTTPPRPPPPSEARAKRTYQKEQPAERSGVSSTGRASVWLAARSSDSCVRCAR